VTAAGWSASWRGSAHTRAIDAPRPRRHRRAAAVAPGSGKQRPPRPRRHLRGVAAVSPPPLCRRRYRRRTGRRDAAPRPRPPLDGGRAAQVSQSALATTSVQPISPPPTLPTRSHHHLRPHQSAHELYLGNHHAPNYPAFAPPLSAPRLRP